MVSESLAPSSPLLSSLLLMDNDIATVAEGALDVVKDLKQLDLTGITDFKITLHLWPHQKCIVCGVL